MKKAAIRWWAILIIVLIVYNVVVFAAPFSRNGVFFLSWLFTMAAGAAQAYVIPKAFSHGEGARSRFYGFPIARTGVLYFLVQLVLGLLFMALGATVSVPFWIPLVLYVALLGAAAVGLVAADAVREQVEGQEVKLKKDTGYMRILQAKMASVTPLAQDKQVKEALEKFAEDLRFSDPVSSVALKDIEADLTACVNELQQAVVDGDNASARALAQKASAVLLERNRMCKEQKRAEY